MLYEVITGVTWIFIVPNLSANSMTSWLLMMTSNRVLAKVSICDPSTKAKLAGWCVWMDSAMVCLFFSSSSRVSLAGQKITVTMRNNFV